MVMMKGGDGLQIVEMKRKLREILMMMVKSKDGGADDDLLIIATYPVHLPCFILSTSKNSIDS